MLLKRKIPFKLLSLEALLRRLNVNDTDFGYYLDLYQKMKVGFEGETQVDNEWDEVDIPHGYSLFHNYETVNEFGKSHQIDSVFFNKQFIWLIEIKNISGILEIEENKNQFARKNLDGTINSFSNPIDQVERHARFIRRSLRRWGLYLPIETSVIVAKNSSIIGDIPGTVSIFHRSGLQSKLNGLLQKYSKVSMSDEQYKSFQMKLIDMYHQKKWRPNLNNKNIRKGVLCKNCDYKIIMTFKHGAFLCPQCKTKSKDAFVQAIYDYKYLYSDWVSNSELRYFLGIESRYSVARLLKGLGFEYKGSFKDRKYKIPDVGFVFIQN